MHTIRIPVDTRPAHILGKRNSTHASAGALSATADTRALALFELELDVHARLRFPDPVYRGGAKTLRVYALTCQGQSGMANGTATYSWRVTILDPREQHPAGGGMTFSATTERDAIAKLESYVDSCEGAAEGVDRSV